MENRKPKVLWLTNVVTPYRIPMWHWLSKSVDLTLGMLRDPGRNRFGDWDEAALGIETRFLHAPTLSIGRRALYFPNLALHRTLMGDFDFYVLAGWESPAYFYALLIAKLRGIKVIAHAGSTSHSSEFSGNFISKLRGWFHRKLDYVVSYGTECTEFLCELGVDPNRISTAFNSVDTTYFFEEISRIRDGAAGEHGHRYIFVGRLMALKNIPNIIMAFQSIKESGDTLKIIGRGKMREELVALVQENSLNDAVEFVEHKSQLELIEEYGQANTLILASTNEVWGLVVNEALTCGINVVVSNKCGIASDIKGMDGVYISGTDVASIASKMSESRANWTGARPDPEILRYTIEAYGQHFISAMNELS